MLAEIRRRLALPKGVPVGPKETKRSPPTKTIPPHLYAERGPVECWNRDYRMPWPVGVKADQSWRFPIRLPTMFALLAQYAHGPGLRRRIGPAPIT